MARKQMGMSLESVIDEERKDVLSILQADKRKADANDRAASPSLNTRTPIRSMLDVGDAPTVVSKPRRTSIGKGSPIPQITSQPPVRSMLDISTPLPPSVPVYKSVNGNARLNTSTTTSSKSAHTSPTETHNNYKSNLSNGQHPRSLSDAATRPPSDFGTRTSPSIQDAYQFGAFSPSILSNLPKRTTIGGKRPSLPSAMSEIVRGADLSILGGQVDAKSRSPHNRFNLRSSSPSADSDSSTLKLDNGKVLDVDNAYRKLSDANLARSEGGLSTLGERTQRRRLNSKDAEGSSGMRLKKDYTGDDDSEDQNSCSEEERRGRKQTNKADKDGISTLGLGRAKGPRTAQSLMAAAEEERREISKKYQVRSLIDPEINVIASSGENRALKISKMIRKPGVHPTTSFDDSASGLNTPVDSDNEADLSDIKRAQKLAINMTSVVSTPDTNRCVRTIYRGDFQQMQDEAQDHSRHVRKYLVATDLSEEAAHALEWSIGTVLRDGDTLLAIYCVDEELGLVGNDAIGDDSLQKDQVSAIGSSTRPSVSTPVLGPSYIPSPLAQSSFGLDSVNEKGSPAGRERSKPEQERYKAVQDITDRVAKLLRKTKLQVKVVIEVIHCKSPKHLITEVIDYIHPTLVILGSRGRSALKGVILGSFSNYLVTKSSVPVMVARKKLRKHNKSIKRPVLANNLNPAVKTLASAIID